MRILEVNKYYYKRRGAEIYMMAVMDALQELGHETAIFSMAHPHNLETSWEKYFVDYLDTEHLHWGQIPKYVARAFWSRQAYIRVRAMIDEFHPDIAHVHNVYTHLSPSVLQGCASKGVPVVLTLHDYGLVSGNYALWNGNQSMFPDHMGFWDIIRSRYIKGSMVATGMLEIISRLHRYFGMYDRYIDQYVAVSGAVRDVLVWSGVNANKITVLHNFAEVEGMPRADMPKGFFYYGALEANKGISTLLKAAQDINEPVYVAGRGPLQAQVERAGGSIEYLGVLSLQEIMARLATVRAAVFPSLSREVYSTAALEALLVGTPVIVSDAGGFKEMVHDGEFGNVFRAGYSDELRATMEFVLTHQDLVEARARVAANWLREHEGKDAHMRKLTHIFEQVVE